MYLATKKNLKLSIFLIVIFAAILRLYKLGDYPVSIYWDEAAIGYNAYSIAKTGADEYGKKWPLSFESFNDYKLPGYIYLDSIFVKFLGLSEFSVRLPSAIAGIVTVFFVYLLVKRLFEKENVAQLCALLFTISPWSIQLSRAAFETNIALTLIVIGIYFLFSGINKKIFALLAIPTLALSFYFYYSAYIFAPLITAAFLFIYRGETVKNIKYYLAGIFIGVLIIIPSLSQLLTPQGAKHIREVSIFADRSIVEPYIQASVQSQNPLAKLFLNRRIPIIQEALSNYASHFSPGFLFFGADTNARHHPVQMGGLYIWQIPFLISGLWLLAKLKDKKIKYFLLALIMASPIPAAFTVEAPHSLRSYNLLLPLVILSVLGAVYLIRSNLAKIITVIVAAVFFIHYLFNYYVIYPSKHDTAWAYGYKSLYQNIKQLESEFDTIIVTGYYWKPYIYYLFYNQLDPRIYQSNPDQTKIGKYRFGVAGWDTGGQDLNEGLLNSLKSGKTLIVLSPQEFANERTKSRFSPIFEIKNYSQTKTIFIIF